MIEDLIMHFSTQSEIESWAWSMGIMLFGFALALLIHRGTSWTLRRVPYFVTVTGLIFLQSVLSLALLASANVIEPGGLSLFLTIFFLGLIVFGYLYGMISLARSIDCYGNGRSAWMAVVPVIFLGLWFKASLDDKKPSSFVRTVGNASAVVLGLVLLFLSQIINNGSDLAVDYMAESAEAGTGLTATSRQAKAQPQTLSQAQASTSVPARSVEVIQIKGLHNAMDLDEVLMAIHNIGGTCSSIENYDETGLWTSCEIHDKARQGDWNQTDISLSSDRTRSGLVLTDIHLHCAYINTCGMSSHEVTEALRSAGVLSRNSDSGLIRIDGDGDIKLSIIETDKPNFN